MIRKSYYLTDKERGEFNKLPRDEECVGHEFWGIVAHSRGLDPETVLGDSENPSIFSAMPYGHGKDWCHPFPLKLTRKARWTGKDVYFER